MKQPKPRLPPHSIEAEEALLSSVFIDGVQSLSKALDGHIKPESFYVVANGLIFQSFLWLHQNGRELTVDVMVQELERVSKLESIGGRAYLLQVSGKVPTTMELPYYIERVRELYVLRQLILAGTKVAEDAYEQTEELEVEKFTETVNNILSIRHSSQKVKTLAMATKDAIQVAERIRKGEATEEDMGLTWPWPDFNARFGEKIPGQLIILAARPGVGKSSMCRQDCMHTADKYGTTALFSREMPVNELPFLFAQQLCGHSWKHYRKKQLHNEEMTEFMASLNEVLGMRNLSVFDMDKTLAQLTARIRAFAQVNPLKEVVIDYLQRYDPQQERGETRDTALGRITSAMKDMAVDLKIPVILLSQISRGVEKESREPRLSDLRECGSAEADADRVIFLHAPSENKVTGAAQDVNDDSVDTVYVEAIQAKGRGDGRARCDLYFYKPSTTFKSVIPEPKVNGNHYRNQYAE